MNQLLALSLVAVAFAFGCAILMRRLSLRLLAQHGSDSAETRTRLASIVEHSNDAIFTKGRDGRITAWNAAASRLYGYEAAEVLGKNVSQLVPPERSGEEALLLSRVLAGETVEHYETRRRCRNGSIVEVSLTASPLYGQGPEPVGASIIVRDISERSLAASRAALLGEARRRLSASRDPVATAFAVCRLVVPRVGCRCVVDVLNGVLGLERLAAVPGDPDGYAATAAPPRIVRNVLATGEQQLALVVDAAMLECISISDGELELARPGGVRSLAVFPLVVQGRAIGVVSVGFESEPSEGDLDMLKAFTERAASAIENARLSEEARSARAAAFHSGEELESAQVRFRVAFEEAPIGVALISMQPGESGRFLQVNPALCLLTGHPAADLERRTFMSLIHPDASDGDVDIASSMVSGTASELLAETRYLHADGHAISVQIHTKLVRSDTGEPLYGVSHIQDVSERKEHQDRLLHIADHDPLTGLFNRRRLEHELERLSLDLERYGVPASLLVLDLDNFKYVNDTYGHGVGDEVIGLASQVIVRASRRTDLVARLGGDEFAILLSRTDVEGAEAHAQHLLAELRARPLTTVADQPLYVTASIGIASVGAAVRLGASGLLVEADIAMYDAKESGRDRVCHVDVDGDRSARLRSRLLWSQRIRAALESDRFELWEQPIVTVASGLTERVEILVRMLGDDGERIAPGSFLPIAEHFGQIRAIDRWVIDHSVELLEARQAAGCDAHMEVNLSGATITDSEVIEFIVDRVRTASIDPTRLTFEVTETAAIVNIERARQFARRLADLGCRFALDDFGSGFGSFYYLKHLPFDLVKIDGDFIRDLPRSRADQLTVQAIVQIASGLGKQTVAEFVGDEETMRLLREYGVDYAQGYYIGKPRPACPPAILVAAAAV